MATWVKAEDYDAETARAERAADNLARSRAKQKATMHKVGQVMTATTTATVLGMGESYAGQDLTFAGVPVEAIVAFAGLTGGAMGIGGDTWSEYIGAAGTGAACVTAYKWAVDADAVAGDSIAGDEIGARRKRQTKNERMPERLPQGNRVALPPGLVRNRSVSNADNEAKIAMRRLGLIA